ncbi:HAMP domain-containing protein [Streptomyces scopuliridis]
MGSELRGLQALDRHIRYAALATLAVVVPLTVLAAEPVLRRLRRIAGTTRRIKRGDLDARTRSRGHDEIGKISSAVDLMADALQDWLRSEQRFTADVAHELRTRSSASSPPTPSSRRARPPTWYATASRCCAPSWTTSWRSPAWTRGPKKPTPNRCRSPTW